MPLDCTSLASDSPANRTAIAGAGGIEAVTGAMARFPDVQAIGCTALRNLAIDNPANLAVIEDAGGVATKCHAGQYCDGSGGLQTTPRDDSDPSCAGDCSRCSDEQVLAAMAAAPDHGTFQANGLWALRNLANSPANRAAIADEGGIEAVMGAMARLPDDSNVQKNGLWALGNLAWDSPTNRAVIAAVGGIEMVTGAMERHPDEIGVQTHGCWALSSLAEGGGQPFARRPRDDLHVRAVQAAAVAGCSRRSSSSSSSPSSSSPSSWFIHHEDGSASFSSFSIMAAVFLFCMVCCALIGVAIYDRLHAIVAKQPPESKKCAAGNQKVAVAIPDDIESAQEDKGEVPATK